MELFDSSYNWIVAIILVVCLVFMSFLFSMNLLAGLAFAFIPVILTIFYFFLSNPYNPLITAFVASYFIMGIARYIPIPSIGMTADGLLILTFFSLIINSVNTKISWKNGKNEYLFICLIWLIYCILELFNPTASIAAWTTYIRFVAFYAFFISFLVPIIFNKFQDLKKVIFLWSVFSIMAFLKALYQKEVGFDAAEMHWLWAEGKASTHILGSGIRYFSFFTDAANFGSGMGMSMVAFIIIGISTKELKWKIYYIFAGLASGYGMMLSGTRSAMIIPFAGFVFYIFISGKLKIIAGGGIIILLAFFFFKFTTVGQGNAQIRRMRSAFNSKQDASYNLRQQNQARIKVFMADKPFGVGVGLGGGKASKNAPGAFYTQIATDSWTVVLWIETGVVGLTLYITLFLYLQLRGAYIVYFNISNKQLKYLLGALLSAIFGIMVSSFSNEVIAQFPNGIVIFFAYAFVFMAKKMDKELSENSKQLKEYAEQLQ